MILTVKKRNKNQYVSYAKDTLGALMVETRLEFSFTGGMKDILAGAMYREQLEFMRNKYKKELNIVDVTVELNNAKINLLYITIKPNLLGLNTVKEMKGLKARLARKLFRTNGVKLKVFRGNTLIKM